MLSGVAPFRGESAIETLHAILKDEAPPLSAGRECSVELGLVVRHCLEKKREARFQSARDLAFVLEFLVQARPGVARSAAPPSAWSDLRASIASLF